LIARNVNSFPFPVCRETFPKDVTRTLAHYLVTAQYDDLPANVRKEGVRTLLNWVGVAIGGSHHQTVDIAVSALAPFSGPARPRCSGAASASTS
jgi:2-methylcitrate dehydratase PrpD